MTAAGAFRHRITLAAVTRGRDALGGVGETADLGVGLWASVAPISDREHFAQGALQARPELRILIRWRANVLHRARVTWQGRVYEVISVRDPDAGRKVLELLCVSAQPGAHLSPGLPPGPG